MLTSRQHHETHERDLAIGPHVDFPIQLALLLAVEDHQIKAILESLKCTALGLFLIDRLLAIAPSHVDFPFDHALFDVAGGQGPDEAAFLLPLPKRLEFSVNDARDEIAEAATALVVALVM